MPPASTYQQTVQLLMTVCAVRAMCVALESIQLISVQNTQTRPAQVGSTLYRMNKFGVQILKN